MFYLNQVQEKRMNLSYFSFIVKGEEMNNNFREGIDRGEVVQERSCETDR